MNKLTTVVAAGLLLSAGFSLSTSVKADTPTTTTTPAVVQGKHHHESELQKLTQELNLTPDQVSKIQPIVDAAKAKVKAIRQDATLTPDQQKAQIAPIHKQEMQDIRAILTPEQIATLKSLHKNHNQPAPAPAANPAT